MGRPKRPFSGVEDIEPTSDLWMSDVATRKLGVRQERRWDASLAWHYRVPNGQYDPLTYLVILDQIAHIDPNIELRAGNLTVFMNKTNRAFIFDPVTVGKVLSDLCDGFDEILGAKLGFLERGRDWRGTFYVIHRDPANAALYRNLREDLMTLTQVEMEARAFRRPLERIASPLLECPSMRGKWNEQAEA